MKILVAKITSVVRQLFEKRIARPWPLIRIGFFALCYIVLIDALVSRPVPPQTTMLSSHAVFVDALAPRAELPVGFSRLLDPPGDDEYRVVWVGGSSLNTIGPDGTRHYLPEAVAAGINLPQGKRLSMVMYLVHASRVYDQYLAVLHALRQSPDLLIVSLNPLWGLCNKAIAFRDDLHPEGTVLVMGHMKSWLLHAALVSPSDMVTGVLTHELVGMRWRYAGIKGILKGLLGVQPSTKPASSAGNAVAEHQVPANEQLEQGPEAQEKKRQPIFFWIDNEGFPPDADLQRFVLAHYFDDSLDGTNARIYGLMLDAIRDAGVKAVLYTVPVDPKALDDELVRNRLQRYALFWQALSQQLDSKQEVWFLNEEQPIDAKYFLDYVHLEDFAGLPQIFSVCIRNEMDGGVCHDEKNR